jgi:hypothetical protein
MHDDGGEGLRLCICSVVVIGGGLVLCPSAGPRDLSEKRMPPSSSPPPPPPPISPVQIVALSHAAFLLLPAYLLLRSSPKDLDVVASICHF